MTPKEIRGALARLDLSQAEFGRLIGMDQSAIHRYTRDTALSSHRQIHPAAAAWLRAAIAILNAGEFNALAIMLGRTQERKPKHEKTGSAAG